MPEFPLDVEKSQAFLHERIIPAAGPERVILGSWVGLGGMGARGYAAMLERLYSVFGSFGVIVTIRNPLTWIISQYLQHLRGHFINSNNPWMGKSPYIDLDSWLKKLVLSRNSLDELFSYRANIEAAINLLGKDNVGVFVFENLINDPSQYYREILDFIGIDISQGLELTANSHLQPSMTQTQFSNLRRLDQPPIWRKLLLKERKYRRYVFKAGADNGAPVNIALPTHWKKGIADATRSKNRWIANNYGLPLGEFGYPI